MNTIVVVANGGQARFFTLEAAESPAYQSSPRLVEQESLLNPQQEAAGKDLWSDNKSGRNRSSGGGGAHGYDDHRDQHRTEYERRFAAKIADQTLRLSHDRQAGRIVLAAEKRVLGMMREALSNRNGFDLREVAKDYSKFTPHELHAQLASLDLLAPRRKPGSQ